MTVTYAKANTKVVGYCNG